MKDTIEIMTDFTITSGSDIMHALRDIDRKFYVATCKKYSSDHIFDENQTVKWNREEAARRNKEILEDFTRTREMKFESLKNLDRAIINYIMKDSIWECDFTEAEANAILQAAKEHHSDEWWNWLDEMASTAFALYWAREHGGEQND